MAGLLSLVTKLSQTSLPVPTAAYLITLDPKTDAPVAARTLQYYPDSISDNKSVSWQAKEIPGASLPMYQWTGSGERTISFTARFSCDVDFLTKAMAETPGDGNAALNAMDLTAISNRIRNTGQGHYNVDIRSAVAWLRSHILPTYNDRGEPIAPPKMILYLPRSGIGLAGGDVENFVNQPDAVVCVMASCDVTYDAFFPSGLPRLASVSLSFNQIPQYRGTIRFPTGVPSGITITNAETIYSAINGAATGSKKYLGYSSRFKNVKATSSDRGFTGVTVGGY